MLTVKLTLNAQGSALRLARFFGTSAKFWLNLQTAYDLDVYTDLLTSRLPKEVEVLRHVG